MSSLKDGLLIEIIFEVKLRYAPVGSELVLLKFSVIPARAFPRTLIKLVSYKNLKHISFYGYKSYGFDIMDFT